MKVAHADLEAHRLSITSLDAVETVGLHLESRITYDNEKCILILHGGRYYKQQVETIVATFGLLFDVTPEIGPAPAGKAERAARAVANRGKKKKA